MPPGHCAHQEREERGGPVFGLAQRRDQHQDGADGGQRRGRLRRHARTG